MIKFPSVFFSSLLCSSDKLIKFYLQEDEEEKRYIHCSLFICSNDRDEV